ncbi:MAG: HpcH/HpaI aldolase/citrate lyase family protein [Halobacteriota archaeon]
MARRSVLFSPGDRPKLMWKAPNLGSDVVVFDLEDAVGPTKKDEARTAVHDVLADPDFDPDAEVLVRVNRDDAAADIDAVVDDDVRLDGVMVPKVSGTGDVTTVRERLAEAGRPVPLLAQIESARGLLRAEDIAFAEGVDALVFGAEDFAADVGATRTDEGTEMLYAREHLVLIASAAGIDAIDTVYTDFEDSEGLAAETEFALTLGFDGKLAIHPAQVSVINDAFTPPPEQIEWAQKVLAARDEAAAEDRGVFRVDGEMIDAPLVTQAERIAARAAAAEDRDG